MLSDIFKSHTNLLPLFFSQIIGEISKKVAQIQNGKLAFSLKCLIFKSTIRFGDFNLLS